MNSLKQAKPQQLIFSTTISRQLQHIFYASTLPFSVEETQQRNPTKSKKSTLTQQELNKINLLIPRLCLSNNLTTAIHLTTTSLLTNPPHKKSISFSILIHSLTSQPDMAKTMSLLTILRHTQQAHSYLTHLTTMLVISYVKKTRPKEAFKVYQWMLRPGSPCKVEKIVFLALVNGFCQFGLVLEGLRVLRDMVDVGLVPGVGLRRRVYRSLLMEARVREALELDKALCFYCNGDVDGIGKVRELLESIIGNWTE